MLARKGASFTETLWMTMSCRCAKQFNLLYLKIAYKRLIAANTLDSVINSGIKSQPKIFPLCGSHFSFCGKSGKIFINKR
jgi:hypothetical protein